MKVINTLPLVKVTMEAGVRGENSACVGDILNCKLKVEFLNLEKGEQSGYVHSRTYPYLRRDCWYLIITEQTMTGIAAVEKLPIEENVFEKEFQEKITRTGPIEFTCIIANDSYKGLDQVVRCSVNVVAADPTRQEYQYLPEDADLLKEAKPEEEVDTAAEDSDEDKPEEEQDHDELVRRLKRKGLGKAAEQFKTKREEEKESQNARRTLEEIQDQNPFIPEVLKTLQQVKQEKEQLKQKEQAEAKVAKADKKILGAAREPLPDGLFISFMGYAGPLGWEHFVYVPMTGWSL